jgi:hypothetical protein
MGYTTDKLVSFSSYTAYDGVEILPSPFPLVARGDVLPFAKPFMTFAGVGVAGWIMSASFGPRLAGCCGDEDGGERRGSSVRIRSSCGAGLVVLDGGDWGSVAIGGSAMGCAPWLPPVPMGLGCGGSTAGRFGLVEYGRGSMRESDMRGVVSIERVASGEAR